MSWGGLGLWNEHLTRMLHGKLQVVNPPSFDALQEGQLVSNVSECCGVGAEAFVVVRHRNAGDFGMSPALQRLWDQSLHEGIGYQANDHSKRNGNKSQNNSVSPHGWCLSKRGDVEGSSTDHDDQNLPSTHNECDTNEEVILGQSLEDVKVVIQAAVARVLC